MIGLCMTKSMGMKRSDIGRWGANTPHHILPDEGNEYTWYSNEIQGGESVEIVLKPVEKGGIGNENI